MQILSWSGLQKRIKQKEHTHDITVMDIYDIKMKRCEFDQFSSVFS